ncbi:GGDEF domain-containing protein [Vibrio profundi]|uniref:GGDEF domain-containing protein n=1 Tax=Vibrio profundi TaxID=1774960 RepID=UPI0037355C57
MEFHLDIRTLAVVTVVLSFTYFIGLILIQRIQEYIPGLLTLAFAILTFAIGFTLLSFGNDVSFWISKVLANSFIIFGFSLIVHSLCQFRIAPLVFSKVAFLIFPIACFLLIYYSHFYVSTTSRILVISTYVGLCSLMSAMILIKGKANDLKLAIWLLAGIFIINFTFMFVRTTITLSEPDINNFLHAGNIHQFAFIMIIILIIVLGFTFTWMINARLVAAIYNSSMKDSLTQIYNRRAMEDIIPRELARSHRHNTELSIIIADIDHFKEINDNFGHHIGDKVLKGMGSILKHKLRRQDLAFRYGGEEFLILLPDTNVDNAVKAANKLRETIEKQRFASGKKGKWTASFGVSQLHDKEEWDSIIQRADEALYQAKHSGRNTVVSSKPD